MGKTLIREQKASEGMWLTRYDKVSNIYIDTDVVWLGKDDVEYQECTEDEHQEHMVHNNKVRDEMLKAMNEE